VVCLLLLDVFYAGSVIPTLTHMLHRPWKSFFSCASTGLYVFVYSMIFYARKLSIHNWASTFLYFSWSLVLCILFGIMTGTIGYIASWWFVRKIFSSIKVD
jgi:transmembrane 9 superfamily member 2/4